MKSFLAMITPVTSGAHPDHTLPTPQPPGAPDQTLPGDLPKPEHPIYYPLPPGAPVDPEYGIPEDGPRPDQGLPGPQPHPEHPIVLPPDSGGWLPVFIWGPTDPRPTPPIALPPAGEMPEGPIDWKCGWTATTGWVVVGIPTGEHVTPSKKKK